MRKERARCVTRIEGLDIILGGGIPISSLVLVTGDCGTGKTSLAVEFLARGAILGEKGLYITTIERPDKLLSNVPALDFLTDDLVSDGSLTFMEVSKLLELSGIYSTSPNRDEIVKLANAIDRYLVENKISRLVIDSFSALFYANEDLTIIRDLMMVISDTLYKTGCTAIFVTESEPYSGMESAIADGLIVMTNQERRSDLLRTIQVLKMKGTSHSRAKYVIDLTTYGLLITPLLRGGIG